MGTDKTALQWANTTMLEWQLDKLRACGASEILLCGKSDCPYDDVRCIPDSIPDRGPLGGIYSGLNAASHPTAMILCTDAPLLPAETLMDLYRAHRKDITLLRHGPHIEPLIGIYQTSLSALILPLIQQQAVPVRALLEKCEWDAFDFLEDERLLCNCNTPAEYKKAIETAAIRSL